MRYFILILVVSLSSTSMWAQQFNAGEAERKQAHLMMLLKELSAKDPKIAADLSPLLGPLAAENRIHLDRMTGRQRPQSEVEADLETLRRYREGRVQDQSVVPLIENQSERQQFGSSNSIGFSCLLSVTETKEIFNVRNCQARGHDQHLVMALNARVFRNFSMSIRGNESKVQDSIAERLAQKVNRENLNPSSKNSVRFVIKQIRLPENEDGFLQGEVTNFVGEQLPITKQDQQNLPILFNMTSYTAAKAGVLSDAIQVIQENSNLKESFLQDGLLLKFIKNSDENWVVGIGAGHASVAYFNLLKSYYDKIGPGQKVIYRTTSTRTRWTTSTFPDEWSHKIEKTDVGLDIEYYFVPRSYLFVYRMIPPGANPTDPSNYVVLTLSPAVWRISSSFHDYKSSDVTTRFYIDQRYSGDFLEILQTVNPAHFAVKRGETSFSDIVDVTVPKLYR